MTSTQINIALGIIVIVLNAIPVLTKRKYFGVTLAVSLLLAVIRILFM